MKAELKKCESYCDAVEEALLLLKKKFDAHVKRYKDAHCVGAVVLTLGVTGRSKITIQLLLTVSKVK